MAAHNGPYPNAEFDAWEEEGKVTPAPDIGSLAVLNKSEIEQQIATARRFPRQIVQFRREAWQLATLDESTASECIYSLPRKQFDKQSGEWIVKTIEGPSARFAEIINYSWGNTRAGARVVSEEEEFVTAQGLFYDLEKNTAISYEVQRRIQDSRGKRYSLDMIGVTSNAACSIALRNAICKGIPKALWKPIYAAARSVIAGDTKTLVSRREEAVKAFAIFGVTPDMIFQALGVKGIQDVTIEHMVTLKGLLTAIQEGDTTPEQAFSRNSGQDAVAARASQMKVAHMAEIYSQNNGSSSEGTPVAQDPSTAPETKQQAVVTSPSPEPSLQEMDESQDPAAQERRRQLTAQKAELESKRGSGRGQRKTSGVPLEFHEG